LGFFFFLKQTPIPYNARTWLMRAFAVSNQQIAALKEFNELLVANPPVVFHPEAILDLIEAISSSSDFPLEAVKKTLKTSLEFADSMRSQDLVGASNDAHKRQFWSSLATCYARLGDETAVTQALEKFAF